MSILIHSFSSYQLLNEFQTIKYFTYNSYKQIHIKMFCESPRVYIYIICLTSSYLLYIETNILLCITLRHLLILPFQYPFILKSLNSCSVYFITFGSLVTFQSSVLAFLIVGFFFLSVYYSQEWCLFCPIQFFFPWHMVCACKSFQLQSLPVAIFVLVSFKLLWECQLIYEQT